MEFGVKTKGLESAKEMIFPAGGATQYDEPTSKEMYKKTHGNFDPGE
jgi:hypothetical protein